jgi:uncharacterized phiE125 gp8 family phage protein
MRVIQTSSSPAPIDIFDAKSHLRIEWDSAADDDVLNVLIPAAVEFVQNETHSQLATATHRVYLDGFPPTREIVLPKPPLQSVSAVKYLLNNVEQTLSTSAYTVDPSGSKPGRITLNASQSWPAADAVTNSVRIDFQSGYGNAPAVPTVLKTALLMLVGHWYERREAFIDRRLDEVPMAVRSIIDQHAFPEVV